MRFLALKNAHAQDAAGLLLTIQEAFEEKGLGDKIEKHLLYFASDGAEVNKSSRAGLISKLRENYGHYLNSRATLIFAHLFFAHPRESQFHAGLIFAHFQKRGGEVVEKTRPNVRLS